MFIRFSWGMPRPPLSRVKRPLERIMQTVKGSYHNLAALADGGGLNPLQPPHHHHHAMVGGGGGGGGMRRTPGHAATFSALSPLSPLSHGPVAEQEEGAAEMMRNEGGTPKKKAEDQR